MFSVKKDVPSAVAPQPRSGSAGGADTSPEWDPSRRRGPCRENRNRDGGACVQSWTWISRSY